jgi:hypothetical protein
MGLDDNLPDELRDVADRLRDARPTVSELEMDQLKVRTMARISGRASVKGRLTGGLAMRSRGLVVALAVLLLGGTAAGGIAAGGFSNDHSNAAYAQYYPPQSPFPLLALPFAEDQGGSETVYIFGLFFAPNATVSTNNPGITVTKTHYISPFELSVTFTASTGAHTGPVRVTVTNPTTGRSGTRTIFFINGPPSVSRALPSSGRRGQTETVTITGSNFEPGATLKTNNPGIGVSRVHESGSDTITATFAISMSASRGLASVTVTNPDGTTATGNVFTVVDAAPSPTVSRALPSSGRRDQTETVTITGSNFEPGATLTTNNPGIGVSRVHESGSNTITATFAISRNASLGAVSVTVTNPDGGTASGNVFSVST